MDYYLSLPHELGLTAFDFIVAWNQTPECRELAEARLTPSMGSLFNPSQLTGNVLVLSRVASEVDPFALHTFIRQVLSVRGIREPTEITQSTHADGNPMLVLQTLEKMA